MMMTVVMMMMTISG